MSESCVVFAERRRRNVSAIPKARRRPRPADRGEFARMEPECITKTLELKTYIRACEVLSPSFHGAGRKNKSLCVIRIS